MEQLRLDMFIQMWQTAQIEISARADEFSQLDAIIGDGDHGTAIEQAMQAILEASGKSNEFKGLLNDMGFNVMMQTSGSTSTLLGGLLLGMSDHASGEVLDAAGVKAMFAGGVEGVQKQTKATIGDKTMMDALMPAVAAMNQCETNDIKELFRVAAEAALEGAASTVALKANFGRARNYGEKSIGYADSGATSWAALFQSFHQTL